MIPITYENDIVKNVTNEFGLYMSFFPEVVISSLNTPERCGFKQTERMKNFIFHGANHVIPFGNES